ncbi:cupin domain [Pseudonocardia hierapolitana]|uniref:Cupin domain n=1 Tax=Pseudonocardia hierapolitana TaxID=1128676 RepID=A0A561SKA0_9PSEU|nr:cupin domain-containing protein [Pseudonocardia hierapolitana]TWF75273.1 cupin domain [Pseudonocardia hierapolitana]
MSGPLPDFPGAVGITALRVYPWQAADGLCGGSPHMHLCCTEGYIVIGGAGRVQTLTTDGFAEAPLRPGDVVWFTPGTIHRAVNDGDLCVVALMQNSGLPESGDAVLTLPPQYLTDRETYQRAVSLAGPGGPSPDRARARRDLAIEGFAELRRHSEAGNGEALEAFFAAAVALVRPQLASWRDRWEQGAAAASRRTGQQIEALAAGDHRHLREAAVARIEQPPAATLGMCGHLSPYDPGPHRREARSPEREE